MAESSEPVATAATEKAAYSPVADEQWHGPCVARLNNGDWGVFCGRCSQKAGDYVYACQLADDDEWPPSVLTGKVDQAATSTSGHLDVGT